LIKFHSNHLTMVTILKSNNLEAIRAEKSWVVLLCLIFLITLTVMEWVQRRGSAT